jgi:rsbT antagonist protein RsbS
MEGLRRSPMPEQQDLSSIPIQKTRDALVVSIQTDLDDAMIERLREDLLERIRVTHARGVVLDLAGVSVLDAYEFAKLRSVLAMAAVMGATPVVSGLRPGVVSALVELNVDSGSLETALDVEDALAILHPAPNDPTGASSDEAGEVATDATAEATAGEEFGD